MASRIKQLMKFTLWEWINPLCMRRHRHGAFPADLKGVNLGCGIDNPPDWLGMDGGVYLVLGRLPRFIAKRLFGLFATARHMDADTFLSALKSSRIWHVNLQKGLPFENDSVPAVFSSHFFEHMKRDQALALLRDCQRALQPGGLIRICVPDLAEQADLMRDAIAAYEQGDDRAIQAFVTQHDQGFVNAWEHHRFMYDWQGMKLLLTEAGFTEAVQRERDKGELADAARLDSRGGLFVEARKPATP